jgi:hypothetical protein
MAAGWAKGEENARRVALILAASDSFDSPKITKENADYACRLIRFITLDFENSVEPEIVSSSLEKTKRRIIGIIKDGGVKGVLKRAVTQKTQYLNTRQRTDIISDLIEAGEIATAKYRNTMIFWTPRNYADWSAQNVVQK